MYTYGFKTQFKNNSLQESTSYTVTAAMLNTFDGQVNYEVFDKMKNEINSDLLDSMEKLKKRDHYALVENIGLAGGSFYCDKCKQDIEIDDDNDGDNGQEPNEDDIGPVKATYNIGSQIQVSAELSTETIEKMQDHLQHIHHMAGQMMLTLQPEQKASSVLFEFDGSSSYRIKWVFQGEFELTTEKELNDIGQALKEWSWNLET